MKYISSLVLLIFIFFNTTNSFSYSIEGTEFDLDTTPISGHTTKAVSSDGLYTSLSSKSDVGHNHVATDVTDFDTEVSNNTSVAANSAKIGVTVEEENVQPDWDQANTSSDDFIKNKPTIVDWTVDQGVTNIDPGNYDDNQDATEVYLNSYVKPGTSGDVGSTDTVQVAIGKLEKSLEDATAGGGDVNVQSDWSQTDDTLDDYIKNKPTIVDWTADQGTTNIDPGNYTDTNTQLSDAEVKVAYENNSDTNAYTDTEKTKLAGVAVGAEVNRTMDTIPVNGNTANSVSSDGVYDGLATKSNIGHGHVAFDVTDFDTEVSNNVSVVANTAKVGVTVEEQNVQPDWDQTNTGLDDYIKNKPTIPAGNAIIDWTTDQGVTNIDPGNYDDNQDATEVYLNGYTIPASSGSIGSSDTVQVAIGKLEKSLEDATAGGGDVNVQSDWNQTDTGADDYILNKPTIPSGNAIIDWTADQGTTNIDPGNYTDTNTQLSDAEVKIAYENNSDTNAYTDTEKTKLAGIATGAQVNRTLDTIPVNGNTANSVSSDGVYDGLSTKSNLGHGHVATDVTDFDTEVSNNTSVAANTAKIGVTVEEQNVQPDWDQTNTALDDYIKNKPTIPSGNAIIDWTVDQGVTNIDPGNYTDTNTQLSDAEVKVAYENNSDTNAYTDTEKTKLAGIDTGANVNRTMDLTPVNGNTANSVSSDGVYDGLATKSNVGHGHVAADVSDFDTEVSNNTSVVANTAKVGVTVEEQNVQVNWSQTDTGADDYILNKPTIPSGNAIIDWTADQGVTNIDPGNYTDTNTQLSDVEVKIAYENNSDTNAYTDTEKTKLAGIDTGAEVNRTLDTTPISGNTANSVSSAGLYTSLAGKSDTGHGHVAADVSDFDTEVSNNTSVVANTAKVGVTVEEQNVQSDWSQTTTTSDNFIKNKPTIPSGNAIIDWTADQGATNIDPGNYTDTNTQLSDAEVKIAYENNTDTNAYTDIEKTKLAGIATGAEVNRTMDTIPVNGNTANSVSSDGVYDGLATKSNTGHGHVAADVTDFDTEVSNNTSVVANTAKVGVTVEEQNVQSNWSQTNTGADDYILNKPTIPSGNSVIDWTTDQGVTNIDPGNYTDTNTQLSDAEVKTAYENNTDTNAYTDAEKTKLSGIATGAQVNRTMDASPTNGNTANSVSSDGVYDGLATKASSDADKNLLQFTNGDLGTADSGSDRPVYIVTDVAWTSGSMSCDDTITSLVVTIEHSTTPDGTYTSYGTVSATGAITVSGYASITAGTWVRARVSTASTGDATTCWIPFVLTNN